MLWFYLWDIILQCADTLFRPEYMFILIRFNNKIFIENKESVKNAVCFPIYKKIKVKS